MEKWEGAGVARMPQVALPGQVQPLHLRFGDCRSGLSGRGGGIHYLRSLRNFAILAILEICEILRLLECSLQYPVVACQAFYF